MGVESRLLKRGQSKTLLELLINGRSRLRHFARELDASEYVSIYGDLVYMADHGPFQNPDKYKHVGDGVYELKSGTKWDYRIYCFEDGDSVIILVSGAKKEKKKRQSRDIAEAVKFKKAYFVNKAKNQTT